MSDYNIIIEKIQMVLENNLPKDFFTITIQPYRILSTDRIRIAFKPKQKEHNNAIPAKHPQMISFSFDPINLILQPQIYGGYGGRSIQRNPVEEKGDRMYLYCVSETISFRKPKPTEEKVLKALERFCGRYIQTMKDNKEHLKYQDQIDYSFLD